MGNCVQIKSYENILNIIYKFIFYDMQSYLNLPKPLLTFDAKYMKINSLTCNLYCNDECLFFSMMCVFYFFNNAFGFKNLLLVEKINPI